jgi:hypothetical protein
MCAGQPEKPACRQAGCEPFPVFWSGKGLCANGEKQERLSFGFAELAFGSVPDSLPGCASQTGFSLVTFFWRSKRK